MLHISENSWQFIWRHWPNYCALPAFLVMATYLIQRKSFENIVAMYLSHRKFWLRGILYFWLNERNAVLYSNVFIVYFREFRSFIFGRYVVALCRKPNSVNALLYFSLFVLKISNWIILPNHVWMKLFSNEKPKQWSILHANLNKLQTYGYVHLIVAGYPDCNKIW